VHALENFKDFKHVDGFCILNFQTVAVDLYQFVDYFIVK